MADHVVVTTTIDSRDAAFTLARSTVENRLGACAQVIPIDSVFRWDDAIRHDNEWRVEIKTPADKAPELVEHLKSVHTYDVPEIIVVPIIAGSAEYLEWLRTETR